MSPGPSHKKADGLSCCKGRVCVWSVCVYVSVCVCVCGPWSCRVQQHDDTGGSQSFWIVGVPHHLMASQRPSPGLIRPPQAPVCPTGDQRRRRNKEEETQTAAAKILIYEIVSNQPFNTGGVPGATFELGYFGVPYKLLHYEKRVPESWDPQPGLTKELGEGEHVHQCLKVAAITVSPFAQLLKTGE